MGANVPPNVARLVDAAPDLLDALELARATLVVAFSAERSTDELTDLENTLQRVEGALAKARGMSPTSTELPGDRRRTEQLARASQERVQQAVRILGDLIEAVEMDDSEEPLSFEMLGKVQIAREWLSALEAPFLHEDCAGCLGTGLVDHRGSPWTYDVGRSPLGDRPKPCAACAGSGEVPILKDRP